MKEKFGRYFLHLNVSNERLPLCRMDATAVLMKLMGQYNMRHSQYDRPWFEEGVCCVTLIYKACLNEVLVYLKCCFFIAWLPRSQ